VLLYAFFRIPVNHSLSDTEQVDCANTFWNYIKNKIRIKISNKSSDMSLGGAYSLLIDFIASVIFSKPQMIKKNSLESVQWAAFV
jgi:hypothetical protein